ncbi:unnamed protein product [Closterium sp. Yama58-4]|nr:unnamed protein product [Closterium sp. Yama58-4]
MAETRTLDHSSNDTAAASSLPRRKVDSLRVKNTCGGFDITTTPSTSSDTPFSKARHAADAAMIAISSRHHDGHRHRDDGDAGYGDRVAAGDRFFDEDRVFDGGWPAVATSDNARFPTSSSHRRMRLHPAVNPEFHARREEDRRSLDSESPLAADGGSAGFEFDAQRASLVKEEAPDSASSMVDPQFRFHGDLHYQHRQVDASTKLLPLDGKIPSLRLSPVAAPSRHSSRATNEAASSVSTQPALADLAASQSITIGCLVPVDLTPDSVHMLAAVTLAVGEINLSKSLLPNHTLLLAPLNYTTQPVAGQMAALQLASMDPLPVAVVGPRNSDQAALVSPLASFAQVGREGEKRGSEGAVGGRGVPPTQTRLHWSASWHRSLRWAGGGTDGGSGGRVGRHGWEEKRGSF